MINYTPINAVLPLVAKAVRNEDSTLNMLSYALDYYENLGTPLNTKEEIGFFEIVSHKVDLPQGIKTVNLVTYLCSDPSKEDCNSFNACITSNSISQEDYDASATNPCAGNYSISHKLFLDSSYYNNNYMPLKYVGNSKFICTSSPNRFCHECNETFSVDENKVLWTSLKSGFLSILHDVVLKNNDGDFLIFDHSDVKKFLAYAIEYEHFKNRLYMKEEGAGGILNMLENKLHVYHLRALGAINKHLVNARAIHEVTNGDYNSRFFRTLPFTYRSKTEYNG